MWLCLSHPSWAGPDPAESVPGLAFKLVAFQERNIAVPLDWNDPSGKKLTIVARVHNPQAINKPFLFWVGGGPAMESINAYSNVAQGYGIGRELSELSHAYRVVTFDQRGVGRSSPLDRANANMDPALIHRYFTAPSIARDLAKMVLEIAGPNAPFYLVGHSFGGEPIAHYLVQGQGRKPSGVIFLSAAPAIFDTSVFFHERIKTQILINRKIQKERPDLFEKILKARVMIPPASEFDESLDNLFWELGSWDRLEATLDAILRQDPTDHAKLKQLTESPFPLSDLLVYVLDWSFQRWTSQRELVEGLPPEILNQIEPWMILEHRALMSAERQRRLSEPAQAFMKKSDVKLREATVPLDIQRLKLVLRNVPTLMLVGERDVFVPMEWMRDRFHAIASSPAHHFEEINGPYSDHYASISDEALKWAMAKINELQASLTCEKALAPPDDESGQTRPTTPRWQKPWLALKGLFAGKNQ